MRSQHLTQSGVQQVGGGMVATRRVSDARIDLRGDDIPMGARIFSIADTLDAITSDRPYRAAQTIQVAREEIERFSGRQFDPEVVRVFLDMPDTIWEDLRKEINSQIYRFTYPIKPIAVLAAAAPGKTQ